MHMSVKSSSCLAVQLTISMARRQPQTLHMPQHCMLGACTVMLF